MDIFTDGSCRPNPGPGGWAVVVVDNGAITLERTGGEPDSTNNRMELRAIIAALEHVPDGQTATIHTDSNLAVQTLNQWAHGWARNGWTKKSKGEIKNLDLVKQAYAALQAHEGRVTVQWIKAHVGHVYNERADQLANAARPA